MIIMFHLKGKIMRKSALLVVLATLGHFLSYGQISISSTTTPYTQNFNTLRNTSGTSATLPTGWRFLESGVSANTTYGVDAGSSTTGNTYSYGTGTNTERALGSLQSSSVYSLMGIQIRNTTGQTITSLEISYTGEQWRCGATGRGADRLDFSYSTNSTNLANGTWINQDLLDFQSPFITSAGARDGNAVGNRQLISGTITGIAIPNNGIIWLRWTDFNITGSDDGLAIDDISILPRAADLIPPVISSLLPANGSSNVALNPPLTINFSEPIQKGTGAITVRNISNASVVQTIDVASASVTIAGSTVNAPSIIPYSSNVYIEISAGAFRDLAGNNFAGISGSAAWQFSIIPPPTPVLTVTPDTLSFDYVAFGSTSPSKTFSFTATNIFSDLTLTAPVGYQLSKDGVTFTPSLVYASAEVQTSKTVSVRFVPPAISNVYTGRVAFASGTWSNSRVGLSGNSNPPPPADTLKVVNWNIEWFGGANGPTNDSLQQENVQTVLKNINADVYALSEIVSVPRLQTIVNQMPGYSFIVSDFCSNGSTTTSCASAQKLAFIFRTSRVNRIRQYGVLRQGGSANASYNWSTGRFPYLMEADVTMNGTTQRIQFVVVHAKANTSDFVVSYNRRKAGADELRDSLNVQYGNSNVIVLGDFNDDLDKTITTQIFPDTTTSWISFKQDLVNFNTVTLPLSLAGIPSMSSYPDIIDHVVISNEMNRFYVPGSAKVLRSEVQAWIPNYATTTSDHFPVQTCYVLTAPIASSRFTSIGRPAFKWTSSVSGPGRIRISISSLKGTPVSFRLTDINARVLYQQQNQVVDGVSVIELQTGVVVPGIYFLQLNGNGWTETRKVFIGD
jgi:endonuclease/exonuclease/phosphatase family metal-dependent hydrolase